MTEHRKKPEDLRSKHWFDDLTFRGLMRLRGLERRAPENLAEGFYARKLQVA